MICLRIGLAVLAVGCLVMAPDAQAAQKAPSWVTSWALPLNVPDSTTFSGQTERVLMRPSFGGPRMRVLFSNATGTAPLTLGPASVGQAAAGSALQPRSATPLTFGGQATTTIPPGGERYSDPVRFTVTALHGLAVSVFVPGNVAPTTATGDGELATHYTTTGDHVADTTGDAFGAAANGSFFVTGVDVYAPNDGLIVAMGDSITVGYNAGDEGWPYWLANRLVDLAANGGPRLAVVDMGISGNRLTADGTNLTGGGYSGLHRLQRDVLDQTGIRGVLLMEGINDIGGIAGNPPVPATTVEEALHDLITRVHAAGAGILVSPYTPAGDLQQPVLAGLDYSSPMGVQARHDVSTWIRSTSGAYSPAFDFATVISDPRDPDEVAAAFDSGDHLHPNVPGQQALAAHIDLAAVERLGDWVKVPTNVPAAVTLRLRARRSGDGRRLRITARLLAHVCRGGIIVLNVRHGDAATTLQRRLTDCTTTVTVGVTPRRTVRIRASFTGTAMLRPATAKLIAPDPAPGSRARTERPLIARHGGRIHRTEQYPRKRGRQDHG